MCGRYTLFIAPEILADLLRLRWLRFDLEPRFNIAPTQKVPIVRDVEGGERELVGAQWGLIPFWAKDRALASRLINARSESADEKPSFRHAFKRRRCIVPASGFYEWKKTGSRKQPYYIRRADDRPMCFAGLWESWQSPEDHDHVESCTILTTAANESLAELHDRMPVLLSTDQHDAWLDPTNEDVASLKAMLRHAPADALAMHPVSTRVNTPRHDDASLIRDAAIESNPPNGDEKSRQHEAGLFD